jgi:molybdopterin-binding protein
MTQLLTVRAAAERLGVAYSTLKLMSQERKSEPSVPSAAGGKSAPATGVLVALSGRNQLRGIVEEVRSDGLLSQVRLRIGDQFLTAVITRDAVNELKLKRGDEAVAIIKSTEVMIGRTSNDAQRRR